MNDRTLPVELRCPACGKDLAKCQAVDLLQMRCGRCKAIVLFVDARRSIVLRPGPIKK